MTQNFNAKILCVKGQNPSRCSSLRVTLFLSGVVCALLVVQANIAFSRSFDIKKLPLGKNVTLLRPATTLVPMATRAKLEATDTPQTVSFKTVWKGSPTAKLARNIKLAIYAGGAKKARYVKIQVGVPFLYSFKGLSSITVIPESASGGSFGKSVHNLRLQIESDRPLSVGR